MPDAARRHNRVVQVGTQRRSSKLYAQLAELVQSGAIGKVTVARAGLTNNMSPNGIGKVADSPPPEGLGWDMWLGPRPDRPFDWVSQAERFTNHPAANELLDYEYRQPWSHV